MTTVYPKKLSNQKSKKFNSNQKNDIDTDYDNVTTNKNYLNIWRINPAYKDIKSTFIKGIVLYTVIFLPAVLMYLKSFDLVQSIGFAVFFFFLFLISFNENFFYLRNLLSYTFRNYTDINPFDKLNFWMLKEDPSTLIFINVETLLNVATRVFKIKILPENVQSTVNQFLKSLNNTRIPFTYQVVQTPLFKNSNTRAKLNPRHRQEEFQEKGLSGSFQTHIYFSVYYDMKGILSKPKLTRLLDKIDFFSANMKSDFSANFHHTKIELLSGNDLINAIRTIFFKQDIALQKKNYILSSNKKIANLGMKILFLVFFISYYTYVLNFIVSSNSLIAFIDLIIVGFIVFLWWKRPFYSITKFLLSRKQNVDLIDPFFDVEFFRLRKYKDIIFSHIDENLLVGTKIFNLKYATRSMFYYPDKFFRSLNKHRISYTYSADISPISYYVFYKKCFKFLNSRDKKYLTENIGSNREAEEWLNMRTGVWRTILNISTSLYQNTPSISYTQIENLEKQLTRNAMVIKKAFEMNFSQFLLKKLQNQMLESGLITTFLKNKFYRANGTHLRYIFFQGKTLMALIGIVPEFKKGLETRIAAEFNSPLQLENFITIGNTINTEFLEEEVPLGFMFTQLHNLLITNGKPESRESLKMKIVIELMKKNVSSIIFDFYGDWSKIIRYFDNSEYSRKILYFKLGKTFTINLGHSGIQYDTNNVDYLNYFFDSYALAFKQDKRSVETLKRTINDNEKLDLSSITLDIEMKQKWEKSPHSDSIISLFKDFTQDNIITSDMIYDYNEKINPIYFLRNKKTIIIDLSILKDLEQKTFVAFVILSKFLHYINNKSDYCKKIILVPNVDIFFDSNYLDRSANYGKIDKFITPFLKNGFGLIFSTNQARYLHPHIYNFLQNLIAFRTTDSRDIAVLKNQMNLQELQGTGYYSPKRKNTYQIDYLMNMKPEEIMIRRSDIYQPFPGNTDVDKIARTLPLSYDEIISHMESLGFNIKVAEKRIIERVKQTLFEKDLGKYIVFLEEIISFLNTVKTVDKIGNLYHAKLKKELLNFIYPKASKKTSYKVMIKEIRDEILEILVKQGYLVESHPKMASGSHTIRTSYIVGKKYFNALEDYFQTKKDSLPDVLFEKIEGEPEKDILFKSFYQGEKHPSFKDIVSVGWRNSFKDFYEIHNNIEDHNYEQALKIGKEVVRKFLDLLYSNYIKNSDLHDINKNLDAFFNYLSNNKVFPFNKKDFFVFMEQSKNLSEARGDLQEKAKKMLELVSKFCKKLQLFLEGK